MTTDQKYEYLINNDICTEDEVELVTAIAGYNDEVLENILYYRTGYNDFETYDEENQQIIHKHYRQT